MSPPATAGSGGASIKTRTCFLILGFIEDVSVEIWRKLGEVLDIAVTIANLPRGHATHHLVVPHVTVNYRPGRNDRPLADGDAGQDDGPGPDPCVVANRHGIADSRERRLVVVMMQTEDAGLEGDVHVVANYDAHPAIQVGFAIDHAVVPDAYIGARRVSRDEHPHTHVRIGTYRNAQHPPQVEAAHSLIGKSRKEVIPQIVLEAHQHIQETAPLEPLSHPVHQECASENIRETTLGDGEPSVADDAKSECHQSLDEQITPIRLGPE